MDVIEFSPPERKTLSRMERKYSKQWKKQVKLGFCNENSSIGVKHIKKILS